MIRRPPRSTRTDTLFPYTTLFRSHLAMTHVVAAHYLAVAALAIAPFFRARRVGGVKFGLADLAVLAGLHRREAFVMAFRQIGGPFLLHCLTVTVTFRLGDRAIIVGDDHGDLLVELLLKLGA